MAELARKSGYPIHLSEEAAQSVRKVSLDTGDTTFWDALGRLCQAAGLVENKSLMGPFDPRGTLPTGSRVNEVISAAPGIHLTVGEMPKAPTVVAGSVRICVVKAVPAPRGAVDVFLEVSGEPCLCGLQAIGGPRLAKARDGQGQDLVPDLTADAPLRPERVSASKLLGHRGGRWVLILPDGTPLKGDCFGPAPPVGQGPCLVIVRLQRGKMNAKSLKELSGRLVLQTTVEAEAPAVVDKVLEAAGRSAKAGDGSTLMVRKVKQLPDKDVCLEVAWEKQVAGNNRGIQTGTGKNQIVWNAKGMSVSGIPGDGSPAPLAGAPQLFDTDGQSWTLAEWKCEGWLITGNQMSHRLTLVYRSTTGKGTPARLVLASRKAVVFEVPFLFKDVPLP